MRAVVDRRGLDRAAASTSQMGRFETAWLTNAANLAALADLSGARIDRVHARRPQTIIVRDMDSSVSETHGAQEGSAYNGHFGCTCYHPPFVFNQFGDLERCALRSGHAYHEAGCLVPAVSSPPMTRSTTSFTAAVITTLPTVTAPTGCRHFRPGPRSPASLLRYSRSSPGTHREHRLDRGPSS